MQKELSEILRGVKDPRVSGALISVTAVSVTPDLKYAKVYYSTLTASDEKDVSDGLRSAGGYVRKRLAEGLNLRITPELSFIRDRSAENGAHIAELLKSVKADLLTGDQPEDENKDPGERGGEDE